MKALFLGLVALACTALPAAAVTLTPCADDAATAGAVNVAEPWERNTRTFSGGKIRVALIDTGGEPACCSYHLVILSPTGEKEIEGRACHIVNDHETSGFVAIDFAKLASTYDPKRGLLLSFPYRLYDDGGGAGKTGVGKVRINSATGEVRVEP